MQTLGSKLKENQDATERPWPMPPEVSTGSYAEICFSKDYWKITPERVVFMERVFEEIWTELASEIANGVMKPVYQVLDGPGAKGKHQCLAAAMFQNHETWQRFVQRCVENNLAVCVSDFTDEDGFNVELHFRSSL